LKRVATVLSLSADNEDQDEDGLSMEETKTRSQVSGPQAV